MSQQFTSHSMGPPSLPGPRASAKSHHHDLKTIQSRSTSSTYDKHDAHHSLSGESTPDESPHLAVRGEAAQQQQSARDEGPRRKRPLPDDTDSSAKRVKNDPTAQPERKPRFDTMVAGTWSSPESPFGHLPICSRSRPDKRFPFYALAPLPPKRPGIVSSVHMVGLRKHPRTQALVITDLDTTLYHERTVVLAQPQFDDIILTHENKILGIESTGADVRGYSLKIHGTRISVKALTDLLLLLGPHLRHLEISNCVAIESEGSWKNLLQVLAMLDFCVFPRLESLALENLKYEESGVVEECLLVPMAQEDCCMRWKALIGEGKAWQWQDLCVSSRTAEISGRDAVEDALSMMLDWRPDSAVPRFTAEGDIQMP